jgi:hypothetical protein
MMQQLGPRVNARAQKNPLDQRVSSLAADQLLDLGFLVHHVLAYNRIEFLDFDLVGSSTLVLVGSVEVTSTGRGDQTNQFTHGAAP